MWLPVFINAPDDFDFEIPVTPYVAKSTLKEHPHKVLASGLKRAPLKFTEVVLESTLYPLVLKVKFCVYIESV